MLARHPVSALALLALALAPAVAQDTAPEVKLLRGRSTEYRAPWPVKGVSVTDPTIADVEVLTPELLLLSARAPGVTDLVMWGENGETHSVAVSSSTDSRSLEADLARLFPGASLEVSDSQNVVVVTGVVTSAEQSQLLESYFEGAAVPFVNLTTVPGVRQVQVKVRVAETTRNQLRQLGFNALVTGTDGFGGSVLGSSAGGPINPVTIGPPLNASAGPNVPFTFNQPVNVSPAVTLFGGIANADLEVFIQALAENQFLRMLAEPTLVALSGEEASFLAGGEFPIPVVQGSASGGAGTSITIEYKEFGVRLSFRPVVLGEGMIRLQLESEVSELSDLGAIEIQGFRVPSVVTRRTNTTLELGSGQSFAMAGLINEQTSSQNSRTPLLGDLPIIGTLFRSVRYRSGETELLVIVTASLVEPLATDELPPLPGTTHLPPTDWELYFNGSLEGGGPARLAPDEAAWMRELGLEELRGPGAWMSH